MNESPYSPPPMNSPYSPPSQPSIPPAPLDGNPKITPSAGWYLLAVAFFAAGIIAAVVLISTALTKYAEVASTIQYVPAPGETEVYLDKAGLYSVYLSQTTFDTQEALIPNALSISVHPVDQPEPIELQPADSRRTFFSLGNKVLLSLHRFNLDQPGSVVIVAKPVEGKEDLATPMELGIGPDIGFDETLAMFYRMFVALAAGVGGFIVAVLIFIVTILRRSRCKHHMRIAAENAAPPPLP